MVEFRLYYDDNGKVICYTCEALPGDNYIVIDKDIFSHSDPFLRVINGEIKRTSDFVIVSKLVESNTGLSCEIDDICVITTQEPNKKWETVTHEFRKN